MGLMNIGRGEGSQIIQLFGRGVRLRGKNMSLKRTDTSQNDDLDTPIELLENLNIFGVRANYMATFRDYLQEEGIETDLEERFVPIRIHDNWVNKGLLIPRLPEGVNYIEQSGIALKGDKTVEVTIDLRPKLEFAASDGNENQAKVDSANQIGQIRKYINILNWERIYLDVLTFTRSKGMTNLSFVQSTLRDIILHQEFLEVYLAIP